MARTTAWLTRRQFEQRLVLFAAAHASTSAISEDGIRAATWGSRPVVEGRLSLFGATLIDFFIIQPFRFLWIAVDLRT